jgi:hypothetical protein
MSQMLLVVIIVAPGMPGVGDVMRVTARNSPVRSSPTETTSTGSSKVKT